MKKSITDLVQGEEAKIFPVLSETSRERRVTSIFLAVMPQIPALATESLRTVGVRVSARTKIETFTEIVFATDKDKNSRPDGLIIVRNGNSVWRALVEAKIARAPLEVEQVTKYVDLARENGIDAVITISNQFVTRADHSPVAVPKAKLKKVKLFHWSWSFIATLCEVMCLQDAVNDKEQHFLIKQFRDFLKHPDTGVERFNQMGATWKDLVNAVKNKDTPKKTSHEVEEAVASWIAEERDLCLHLSSHVGREVTAKIERNFQGESQIRAKVMAGRFVETRELETAIVIPDCASDLMVSADVYGRTISALMKISAPKDRRTTKARVNWVLKMLKSDDERLYLRAYWPGRASPTQRKVLDLRDDPGLIQTDNPAAVPHAFDVLMIEAPGVRFGGRKTFIEDLERVVKEFYNLVGVNLKRWQAPPPKPVAALDTPTEQFPIGSSGHSETPAEEI